MPAIMLLIVVCIEKINLLSLRTASGSEGLITTTEEQSNAGEKNVNYPKESANKRSSVLLVFAS